MAGHSAFKNIMHKKGRKDAARAKLFAKLAREITVAAKSGFPDPDKNPRLRLAVHEARVENMPKDNIERAIKKAVGGDTEAYEAIRYEGYAPGGVAVIVEALTDNRNRTGGAVRAVFSKYDGNLGATGSSPTCSPTSARSPTRPRPERPTPSSKRRSTPAPTTPPRRDRARRHVCLRQLGNGGGRPRRPSSASPRSVKAVWRPTLTASVDEENAQAIVKLIAALEDDDDVQNVYANFEVSDEVMNKLTAA